MWYEDRAAAGCGGRERALSGYERSASRQSRAGQKARRTATGMRTSGSRHPKTENPAPFQISPATPYVDEPGTTGCALGTLLCDLRRVECYSAGEMREDVADIFNPLQVLRVLSHPDSEIVNSMTIFTWNIFKGSRFGVEHCGLLFSRNVRLTRRGPLVPNRLDQRYPGADPRTGRAEWAIGARRYSDRG